MQLLKDLCAVVDVCGRKTICVSDVVFVLNRQGRPIYGFGSAER
jgi:histone H4